MRRWVLVLLAATSLACGKKPPAGARSQPGQGIAWQSYSAGLEQARAEGKPMLVVVSAEWCPHCKNYKHVFEDPQVVSAAGDFVMVRVDEDREPDVAGRLRVDGSYVPRTYFLASDGSISDVHAQNPRYRFFYDERNPASILSGMSAALALAHGPKASTATP